MHTKGINISVDNGYITYEQGYILFVAFISFKKVEE